MNEQNMSTDELVEILYIRGLSASDELRKQPTEEQLRRLASLILKNDQLGNTVTVIPNSITPRNRSEFALTREMASEMIGLLKLGRSLEEASLRLEDIPPLVPEGTALPEIKMGFYCDMKHRVETEELYWSNQDSNWMCRQCVKSLRVSISDMISILNPEGEPESPYLLREHGANRQPDIFNLAKCVMATSASQSRQCEKNDGWWFYPGVTEFMFVDHTIAKGWACPDCAMVLGSTGVSDTDYLLAKMLCMSCVSGSGDDCSNCGYHRNSEAICQVHRWKYSWCPNNHFVAR